ncbi:MAG: gamma-glutamylcyclotransferase family protein [Planctomycetota bacterium]
MTSEDGRFYFAYGNNMREQTMRERVGAQHYRFVCLAVLEGFRLTFTTTTPEWGGLVADLSEDSQGRVFGVLYEVDPQVWVALAPHEPTYDRLLKTVHSLEEDAPPERTQAVVYRVSDANKEPEGPPEPRYLERILGAGIERGLPDAYLEELRQHRT